VLRACVRRVLGNDLLVLFRYLYKNSFEVGHGC
jgi:hypothetical protein